MTGQLVTTLSHTLQREIRENVRFGVNNTPAYVFAKSMLNAPNEKCILSNTSLVETMPSNYFVKDRFGVSEVPRRQGTRIMPIPIRHELNVSKHHTCLKLKSAVQGDGDNDELRRAWKKMINFVEDNYVALVTDRAPFPRVETFFEDQTEPEDSQDAERILFSGGSFDGIIVNPNETRAMPIKTEDYAILIAKTGVPRPQYQMYRTTQTTDLIPTRFVGRQGEEHLPFGNIANARFIGRRIPNPSDHPFRIELEFNNFELMMKANNAQYPTMRPRDRVDHVLTFVTKSRRSMVGCTDQMDDEGSEGLEDWQERQLTIPEEVECRQQQLELRQMIQLLKPGGFSVANVPNWVKTWCYRPIAQPIAMRNQWYELWATTNLEDYAGTVDMK